MCLYPLKMQRVVDLITGELKVCSFNVKAENVVEVFDVPCGKCLECCQTQSNEWAFRLVQELQCNGGVGCMLTLTYAETDGQLSKRDLQLFMKRLRKHFSNDKIRFFACGEYGAKLSRPHYHVILFGVDFANDKYFWKRSGKGFDIFRSPTLEKIWTAGYSTISEINFYTAKYSAKYLQKLQPVDEGIEKPFTVMSRRPGIGYNAISTDILTTDKIYVNGKYIKTPRYYLKVLERNGVDLADVKSIRLQKAKIFEKTFEQLEIARKKSKDFCKK